MNPEINRRSFIGLGLGALAGCQCPCRGPKSVSDYKGVEVGAITYSYRSMPCDAESVLKYALADKLGTLELMGAVAETYAGAPLVDRKKKGSKEALSAWRKQHGMASLGKFRELRDMYAAAGVSLHIVKFGEIGTVSDEENEYFFAVAKALGAGAITREVPSPSGYETLGRKCAELADRHGVFVAFHNHTQIDALTYDGPLLGYSNNLRINFDIGHYVAASTDDATRFIDPLAFIEKYHDKIYSIHIKDRTTKANGSQNLPFGKGDTPLTRLFPFLQEKGYAYPCDIELEYKIPEGSDAVKEVAICNDYCRKAAGC